MEWLTLKPAIGFFPQTSHRVAKVGLLAPDFSPRRYAAVEVVTRFFREAAKTAIICALRPYPGTVHNRHQ